MLAVDKFSNGSLPSVSSLISSESVDIGIDLSEECEKASQNTILISYGIGSPCISWQSRVQTAILILLRELILSPQVLVYDPVFKETDKCVFHKLEVGVIDDNEECFRSVQGNTVFFMPHGCWAMYNNLLYSNWDISLLRKMVIIGNDLNNLSSDTIVDKKFKKLYKFIYAVLDYKMFRTRKIDLEKSCETAMVAQSVTSFPLELLPAADHQCWELAREKPHYSQAEVEIVGS